MLSLGGSMFKKKLYKTITVPVLVSNKVRRKTFRTFIQKKYAYSLTNKKC